MSIDKIISLTVVICWLIAAWIVGPIDDGVKANSSKGTLLMVVGVLLFPLGLIWFGEELGDYVGSTGQVPITQRTPGCLVKFFGWAVLLAIIGVWIYKAATRIS